MVEVFKDVKMITFITIIVLYLSSCVQTQSQGFYTVVAPKVLRPHTRYEISISIFNTTSTTQVSVQLSGNLRVSSQVNIRSGETRPITFDIGAWTDGKYELEVAGNGGLNFRNKTEIKFVPRSYNVFIQTDKSVYRSSQKVQFRSIILDKDLWIKNIPVEIYITDSEGSRAKVYKSLSPRLGLLTNELQLPKNPVLGEWTINVLADGQKYKKNFTVAEYYLPGYYVDVKLSPPFITYDNSRVRVTVSAKYTYGKPVKGSIRLTVTPKYRTSSLSLRPINSYQTVQDFDKEITLEINVLNALGLLTDKRKREIEFLAIVTEEDTGRKFNSSSYISIYEDPVKIDLIKTSQSFKPGLPYKAFLKVSRQDDTPLNLANGVLNVKYSYNYKPGALRNSRYIIPKNGLIELNYFPPLLKDTVTIYTKAEFDGKEYDLSYVDKAFSPSDTYMQVSLNTPFPRVGQEIEVLVNCTSELPPYSYHIIARGNIIRSRTMFTNGGKSDSFRIKMTQSMTPLARIVVFFTRPDGEVVADGLSVDLEEIFNNKITLSAGPGLVRPGNNVRVSLQTEPNSMIGLMGIDQKSIIFKSGNDITRNDVIKSMESFDTGKKDSDQETLLQLPVRRGRGLFYPGSLSASSVFDDAGVTVLTNGVVNSFDRSRSRSAPPSGSVFEFKIVRFGDFRQPDSSPIPRTPLIDIDLPPTWLWWNTTAGPDGSAAQSWPVPNTINSWIISAFSISPVNGLSLAQNTAKVTVFRQFFVKLVLPESVVIGEVLSIQAVIFNYNERAAEAEVTLENQGGFEFQTVESDPSIRRAKQMRKIVTVASKEGKGVYFMIKPSRIGFVKIKVFARSSFAGDNSEKQLKVLPNGAPQYFNKALLIDRRTPDGAPISIDVDLRIPRTVVPGSEVIKVSGITDVIGLPMDNLEKLLRIPDGCGEQNTITYIPNVLVLDYLQQVNKLSNELYAKIIKNIGTGYLQQLTYKHDDGSFSAFGKNDESGSTWVTSYVLKSFKQAQKHIPNMIDPEVVKSAMTWLSNQMQFNGTFTEPAVLSNKKIQGDVTQGLPLTAYALIALYENREHYPSLPQAKDNAGRAQSTLERYLLSIQDTYTLALVTYALHLVDSPRKEAAFQRLADKVRFEDESMYWSEDYKTPNNIEEVFHLQRGSDIEMTAYGLMVYVLRGDISSALRIMKWLVQKRNNLGGFTSTQDTVVGLQALTMLAGSMNARGNNLGVTFKYEQIPGNSSGSSSARLNFNDQNSLTLQERTLPKGTRKVTISADGRGLAMIQVSWSYYLDVSAPNPSFTLNPLVDKVSNKAYLQVSSCINYIPRGESGMTVMEYYATSGFVIDRSSIVSIMQVPHVKRVDMDEGGTMLAIYFDKIGQEYVCPTVSSHKVHKVAKQIRKPVIVYDYYERDKIGRVFYQPEDVATLEDICDGYECDKRNRRGRVTSENDKEGGNGAEKSIHNFLFSFVSIIVFIFLK